MLFVLSFNIFQITKIVIFSLKNANFGKNFFAFLVLSSVFDKKHNDKKN